MCKHSWNTFDRAPFTLAPISSPDLQYHPIPTPFPQRCVSLDNWNTAVDDMFRATRPTCETTWRVPEAAPVPPWLLRATHADDADIVVVLKMRQGNGTQAHKHLFLLNCKEVPLICWCGSRTAAIYRRGRKKHRVSAFMEDQRFR